MNPEQIRRGQLGPGTIGLHRLVQQTNTWMSNPERAKHLENRFAT